MERTVTKIRPTMLVILSFIIRVFQKLKRHRRRLKLLALFFCAIVCALSLYFFALDSTEVLYFKYLQTQESNKVCVHPNLFKNDILLDKFYKEPEALACKSHEWIYTAAGRAFYNHTALKILDINPKSVTCTYSELKRADDFKTIVSEERKLHDGEEILTDFFYVKCKAKPRKQNVFRIMMPAPSYNNYHAHIAKKANYKDSNDNDAPLPSDILGMDVLLFGFDSVSQIAFQRNMPKSLKYMNSVLNSVILTGYNIVGDGTPQALIPILTGQTEQELPATLWRIEDSFTVDTYPMIWKEFTRLGYKTLWVEDVPEIGTFQYRMRGFKEQPTDHYGRTFYLGAKNHFRREPDFCLGALPRHKVAFNYISDFLRAYKNERKFGFLFYNELSHDDPSYLKHADGDFKTFLQNHYDKGHLNNTLLVIFSDHGSRFGKIRETSQGLLEERMPFVSVTLPPWFKGKYPFEYSNLIRNSERLTTPFDLHALLQDVVEFRGSSINYTVAQRSISLFGKVPKERTCADANIAHHWCACLAWEPVEITDSVVNLVADALVNHINALLADEREVCSSLALFKIVGASKLKPNKKVLSFSKSKDADGLIPEFKNKVQSVSVVYRIIIETEPGSGLFEATLEYRVGQKLLVDDENVSRINKYSKQSHCIYAKRPDLRAYCFCRDIF